LTSARARTRSATRLVRSRTTSTRRPARKSRPIRPPPSGRRWPERRSRTARICRRRRAKRSAVRTPSRSPRAVARTRRPKRKPPRMKKRTTRRPRRMRRRARRTDKPQRLRAAGKARSQLRACEPAMRDAVLLIRRELGHRAAVAGDDEHGVVAEPSVTARRLRDLAVHFSIEELDASIRRGEGGHAQESRGAVLHPFEEREQSSVALLGRCVFSKETPAAHSRRSA